MFSTIETPTYTPAYVEDTKRRILTDLEALRARVEALCANTVVGITETGKYVAQLEDKLKESTNV